MRPGFNPENAVALSFDVGLQVKAHELMKVGGKARIVCPSRIAYGEKGRPPVIPGGVSLAFEVELLEVVNK